MIIISEFIDYLDSHFTFDREFGNYHVYNTDADIMLQLDQNASFGGVECTLWCDGKEFVLSDVDELKKIINIASRKHKINRLVEIIEG